MSKIIDLALSEGNAYVWSAEDWFKLRTEHRITGELIGCLPSQPRQEILLGLPMLLMPEEVTILIEKGVARLVEHTSIKKEPNEALRKAFEEHRHRLYLEQEVCLIEERRKQVILMMDKIIDGKKRKILGIGANKKKMVQQELDIDIEAAMQAINIDPEVLLKEEMAKLSKFKESDALVQTHTAYPWPNDIEIKTAEWTFPLTPKEVTRYKVFKNLWEQGFYITSAEKFAGDFLVYPGEPMMFHSQFIVLCRDRNETIPIHELVTHCRVGCNVRKTQVFATLSENGEDVQYQSFQWAESRVL